MEDFSLFSSLNSASFENMIADLFNVKENTNTYTLVGRSGQKQNGIDVYSGAKKTAIQCKFKNDLLPSSSIVSQLKKALKAEIIKAKSSNLDFENYILVSI